MSSDHLVDYEQTYHERIWEDFLKEKSLKDNYYEYVEEHYLNNMIDRADAMADRVKDEIAEEHYEKENTTK